MRTEFIELFAELNAHELKNLNTQNKETAVSEPQVKSRKLEFTSANLWNIHNMKRVRYPRRALVF